MSLTIEEILALPDLAEMTLRAHARNRQRAAHLKLALDQPRRLVALRLSAVSVLFASHAPEEAERLLQRTRQTVQDHLDVWSRAQPWVLPVIDTFVQQTLGPLIEPNRKQPHTLIDTPLFRMNASVALLVWRMSEVQRQERP